MRKIFLNLLILSVFFSVQNSYAATSSAKMVTVKPKSGAEVDIDESQLLGLKEKEVTENDVKYDKASDECYNAAEVKLKANGKAAMTENAVESYDPRAEALDRFYTECMKAKGYSVDQPSADEDMEE